MFKSETWQQKHKGILKQLKLYDAFLTDPETKLTYEERSKLIFEMGRLLWWANFIENMTFMETRKATEDYPLMITSALHTKWVK